jgi:hypothetical protein
MECPTAQAFFEKYSVAATEYFDAADKLSNLVGSHGEFVAAQDSLLAADRLHRRPRNWHGRLVLAACSDPAHQYLLGPNARVYATGCVGLGAPYFNADGLPSFAAS